jgi:hypothetical protein
VRRLIVLCVLLPLFSLAGCAVNPRDHARTDFVNQLEHDGGITHDQAVCIVDKFFAHRTTDELKAFFARKNLTDTERAEFAALGKQCVAPTSAGAPASKS